MNALAWVAIAVAVALLVKGDSMYFSADGVAALKAREGFRADQYLDQAGLPTIGYGHLIRAGEVFSGPITPVQAELLLRDDVADAEAVIQAFVRVPLTQSQYDALVSFVFNVGGQAFKNSTLLAKLNAGDYQGAADQLLRWRFVTVNSRKVESAGLITRREAERAQFLT